MMNVPSESRVEPMLQTKYPISLVILSILLSLQPVKRATAEGMTIRVTDAADQSPINSFLVIAGVPSGVSRNFEKTHGVRVINWQSHQLRQGNNGVLIWPSERGYSDMALRVEADGYIPKVVDGLKQGEYPAELTCPLDRDPGVRGSVMTPGGKRMAHDATIALAMIRRNARLVGSQTPELHRPNLGEDASLRDRWDQPRFVTPDDQGRFTLPTEIDPTAVVLFVHGDGVLEVPYAQWRESPDVVLEPWGRIHGSVRWGEKLGAGEQVDLSANRGDHYGYPDIVSQYDKTTVDENGNFVFERVLPGLAQLSCPLAIKSKDGNEVSVYLRSRITHAEVKSPHTPVLIGGRGRTVTGTLTGLDESEFEDFQGITFHLHPNAPHIGFPGDDQQWAAWSQLKSSNIGPLFFREKLDVNADGSFSVSKLPPGYYQIFFSKPGAKNYIASGSFSVPAEDRDEAPDPIDIGSIRLRK